MRTIIAILSMMLAACHGADGISVPDARAQAPALSQTDTRQRVDAFGGTLIGRDDGEWGGEVAFRERNGRTYTVIQDNSHGIFKMPYGIIAITGLAHLGIDRGAVYLLSREPNAEVTATETLKLPGAPCDVARAGNRITMRIANGRKILSTGLPTTIFACFSLNSDKILVAFECPRASETEPDFCVG